MPLYGIDGRLPVLGDGAWVAPSADVIGDARLGDGASVWFRAVIRADNTPIEIGARTNIQEGAMLHSIVGMWSKNRSYSAAQQGLRDVPPIPGLKLLSGSSAR